ncbi:MAG TPA: TonB-dependent receptor [Lentimicrobium sp.]|nr:TonB-dependent receptor [Lentimicrobium sp.]
MKRLLTLMFLVLFTLAGFAQGRVISGKVTDESGTGLPGVTVLVVGTTNGTVTDLDGNYKITANQGTLRFSFIGFTTQEILIGTQNTVNVTLAEEYTELNEVVVIGYGTQQKKDLTTAVVTVDEEEFKDRPIQNAQQALQGKAAGVQVTQPSGKPGSSLSIRVRGATSVLAGNEPLYVVDGLPTTDIRGLNPNDIASMSVLKDASSAAIYGARAANGVVLITTKRGQTGTPNISFNAYYGVNQLRKGLDVLTTKQYRDLMTDMGQSWDPSWSGYTDWNKEVFQTGNHQSYQVSVSGGDEKSKYFVSGGYLTVNGVIHPARYDRYSVRVNLDNKLSKWLTLNTTVNVLDMSTKDTPDNLSSGRGGVIMSALNTPPFLSVYNADRTQFASNPFQPSWENPVAYMQGADQESIDRRVFGSVAGTAEIIKGLSYTSRLGLDMNNHEWNYYLDPFRTNYGRQNHGIGRADKSVTNSVLWENTLTYKTDIGKSTIEGLAGSSIQKQRWSQSYLDGSNFPSDTNVRTLYAANTITGGTNRSEWSLASFFGRVAYDYNDRYYLTVSLRRDGSSKLANHWGTMPSVSAAWRISAENFMQGIDFIDDLKLRGSWGRNGNQEGISDYARFGLINYYRVTPDPNAPLSGPGSVRVTYGNPDLKWETTDQTDLGFDLTTLNGRLTFTFDAYIKKTRDVLLNVSLSNTLPITSIQTNAGEIENKGFEFNIHSVILDKPVNWTTDLNMSFNKNKVVSLDYTDVYYFGRIYSNNQEVSVVRAGLELGSFFGYESEGVDPETGDIIYKDVNGNGVFDTGDRTVIGSGQPDFIFGWTNTFSYKKFDLSIFFQGSYGNEIYNASRVDLEGMFDSKNQLTTVLNRWTPENRNTDIPRARFQNLDNVRNSSRFIEDGSYMRLKSATLSYRLLDNYKFIKVLSLYVTGENLLTFTKYSGFDPEVNAYGNSAVELGIDYGTYPQARSIILGVNVNF